MDVCNLEKQSMICDAGLLQELEMTKAEAIKEFVERLQDRCAKQDGCLWQSDIGAELNEFIGDGEVQWSKQGKCPITPEQFNAIYEDKEGDNE